MCIYAAVAVNGNSCQQHHMAITMTHSAEVVWGFYGLGTKVNQYIYSS